MAFSICKSPSATPIPSEPTALTTTVGDGLSVKFEGVETKPYNYPSAKDAWTVERSGNQLVVCKPDGPSMAVMGDGTFRDTFAESQIAVARGKDIGSSIPQTHGQLTSHATSPRSNDLALSVTREAWRRVWDDNFNGAAGFRELTLPEGQFTAKAAAVTNDVPSTVDVLASLPLGTFRVKCMSRAEFHSRGPGVAGDPTRTKSAQIPAELRIVKTANGIVVIEPINGDSVTLGLDGTGQSATVTGRDSNGHAFTAKPNDFPSWMARISERSIAARVALHADGVLTATFERFLNNAPKGPRVNEMNTVWTGTLALPR